MKETEKRYGDYLKKYGALGVAMVLLGGIGGITIAHWSDTDQVASYDVKNGNISISQAYNSIDLENLGCSTEQGKDDKQVYVKTRTNNLDMSVSGEATAKVDVTVTLVGDNLKVVPEAQSKTGENLNLTFKINNPGGENHEQIVDTNRPLTQQDANAEGIVKLTLTVPVVKEADKVGSFDMNSYKVVAKQVL